MIRQRIFIAGHKGMVGSALFRLLEKQDVELIIREKKELNLLNQQDVHDFFKKEKINQVYLAAAKTGGIYANNIYPAEFIYENLMIQNNVIHNAFLYGVKKILFLGSSCIYPKDLDQPIREQDLLTGKLELTNEPYAIAKIAGIKLCESYNRQFGKNHHIDYRCIMPTNLYGPGDNYHPENSHVIPGLIYRFHDAKRNNSEVVNIWGTGTPKREFLYVDDLAKASICVMNLDKKIYNQHISPMSSHINVGSGKDISINDLANLIREVVGFKGRIEFDKSKPDGVQRKLIDSSLMEIFGFTANTNLKDGLALSYRDFLKKC